MTADLRQLLTAWDRRHPAPTDAPGWRHVLEEMAHPETTAALYALAERAPAQPREEITP